MKAFSFPRYIRLQQEMAPVLDDVMERKIDQPHIKRARLLQQRFSQMIDRWVGFIIDLICQIGIRKEAVFPLYPLFFLFRKFAFLQALKKSGICLGDLRIKQLLQPLDPLLFPLISAAVRPKHPPGCRCLCRVKQPDPPKRLSLLLEDMVFHIRHRPADRTGSHV